MQGIMIVQSLFLPTNQLQSLQIFGRINSDIMSVQKKQSYIQSQTPKRSFLSYICPCFNSGSTHKLNSKVKSSMNHQDSHSKLPSQQKSKEPTYQTQGEINQQKKQKNELQAKINQQSGIYIHFKEDQQLNQEKSEYAIMQQEYDRYLKQNSQPKTKFFPINSFKENHLFVLGNKSCKILCKIKSVFIQPSQSAKKLQQASRKSQQKSSDPVIQKYWDKRYFLFQKFDEGIQLDQQSWFSVTPQAVAQHIASRLSNFEKVLDGFCGAGGDSIKIALNCKRVISNDIDENKINLLINNAAVYGIDNIEATNCDFFDLEFKRNQLDAIYLAPPWGGPQYRKLQKMMPQDFIPPLPQLISKSISLSDNIVFLLPNNTDVQSLPTLIYRAFRDQKILAQSCSIFLEKVFFQGHFKFIILSIGNRVTKINLGDQLQYIYLLLGENNGVFKYKRVIKKIRQEIGMLNLLNYIFESQKINKKNAKLYDNLLDSLIEKALISKQKIAKLQEMDDNDAIKSNQGKKERKLDKKLIKSMRAQAKFTDPGDLRMTYNEAKVETVNSPLKNSKLQQTVSYVSQISQSKILDSAINNGIASNRNSDQDGVKIDLAESKIFQ